MSDAATASTPVASFTLPVVGITLTPSTGSAVTLFSTGNFELTKLQTDTALVATNVKVPAGNYTAVNVTVAAPSGVYFNLSGGTLGSCLANSICAITGAATTITYSFATPLALNSNATQWLNLDFNYNNSIVTTTNNAVAIDMTQSGVMTASSTVPTGVASGNFANVDDFSGQITAINSTSITVTSKLRGSLTASINANTQWFDPLSQCSGGASISCVGVGSVVSVQSLLNTSGLVIASSVDVIDPSQSPSDEVEGILIAPSSCTGGSGLILSDSVINTSGSPLASASFGSGLCISINPNAPYGVDSGILTTQPGVPSGTSVAGFRQTSDLLTGQMVRMQISGAASGSNGLINATANYMLLRFSRLTGTISSTSGTSFYISGLPGYLGTSFNTAPQVFTYVNGTLLEGASSVGSLTGTVSMSSLYMNVNGGAIYWFQAAKARQQ